MWKFIFTICLVAASLSSSGRCVRAQVINPAPEGQSCEELSRSTKGNELQRSAVRIGCEREHVVEVLRLSSDKAYIALREYIAAGESLFATRQRIATEGFNARCPAPGIRNESVPLCTEMAANYDAQVKTNWDAAQDTIKQLNNSLKTLLQHDSRFVSEVSDIQNDRSMRYWMLAAFLLIVVLMSLLLTLAAMFRPRFLPKDLDVNARSIAAFALIILPLFFGFLVDKVPESLIVAVVSGASGWLFGSVTKEPKVP